MRNKKNPIPVGMGLEKEGQQQMGGICIQSQRRVLPARPFSGRVSRTPEVTELLARARRAFKLEGHIVELNRLENAGAVRGIDLQCHAAILGLDFLGRDSDSR